MFNGRELLLIFYAGAAGLVTPVFFRRRINQMEKQIVLRPITKAEAEYCYTQSQQLIGQTGCIGHLRGDFGSGGEEFYTSWDDHRERLKTDEFREEFDNLITALRFERDTGCSLESRKALSSFCMKHPEADITGDLRDFGFRTDTEHYSYLFRFNPNKGEYNVYCYCYVRSSLDYHMKNAEKGIRFIDSSYNELFRIPDGGKIRVTFSDGEKEEYRCHYVDDYHVEIGSGRNLFHICQYAEICERNGSSVEPVST